MSHNGKADLCVAAVRQYHRAGTHAISVDYLDALSDGAWRFEPGFHEKVKDLAYRRYDVEMIYVYERPLNPHWAVHPTDEIRERALWERWGAIETEFERISQRQPFLMPIVQMFIGQARLARQFVGCPDPERENDPVLEYIDRL